MEKKNEFTTENGLVLKIRPVREALVELARMAVEKEFRDRNEPIDVPGYSIVTVTGETQNHEHFYDLTDPAKPKDSLTVEGDPKATAQNFAMWAAHTKAVLRLEDAQGEAAFMAQLEYGVEVEVPEGELALLAKTLKKYGRDCPTDPDEAKALWLVYFGLSRMDKNMLGMELQIAAMGRLVKPEQVESFRGQLRDKVAGLAGDALSQAIDKLGELGSETEVPPTASGTGVSLNSEPVGRIGQA